MIEALQEQLAERDEQLSALGRHSSHPPSPDAATAAAPGDPATASTEAGSTVPWPAVSTPDPSQQLDLHQQSRRGTTALRTSSTNPLFVAAPAAGPVVPAAEASEVNDQRTLINDLQRQVEELQALRASIVQPAALTDAASPAPGHSAAAQPPVQPSAAAPTHAPCQPDAGQPLAQPQVNTLPDVTLALPDAGSAGLAHSPAPGGNGTRHSGVQAPGHPLLFDAATSTPPPTADAGMNTAGSSGCQTDSTGEAQAAGATPAGAHTGGRAARLPALSQASAQPRPVDTGRALQLPSPVDGGGDGGRAELWEARCHELRRALADSSVAIAAGAAAKVRCHSPPPHNSTELTFCCAKWPTSTKLRRQLRLTQRSF